MNVKLTPREERWARRLAEAQAANEELVRLVGLMRELHAIAGRENGLKRGAQAMADALVRSLDLEYCGFYLFQDGDCLLGAQSGLDPSPALAELFRQRVQGGGTFAGGQAGSPGDSHLLCLPLGNGQERLGGLAMVLRQAPDVRSQRHLAAVNEAVAPVLEAFILRGRLQELNQALRAQAQRSSLGMAELDRNHLETEACLRGLMAHDPDPLFVMDRDGRLMRLNPAMEQLLGWSRDHLLGRRLADFLADPADWAKLEGLLENAQGPVEREVPILVQCGERLSAQLSLRPFFGGQGRVGAMGRLCRSDGEATRPGGYLAVDEVRALAELTGEAVNHTNNLLTALRAHLQLLLFHDLAPEARHRLEMLEHLAEEGRGVMHRVQGGFDELERRCREVSAQGQLWGRGGGPLPPGPGGRS